MKKTKTYYWENELHHGEIEAETDSAALIQAQKIEGLWVLYKENDTEDGAPYTILFDFFRSSLDNTTNLN